jgi:glyoxylase-like metal-dependent hydrolase (beta-lactamase superfamily II)
MLPLAGYGQRDWSAATVETTRMAEGVYRLFVDGRVSVTAFTGEDGVLLVDAAYEQTVPQLQAAVAALSDKPIRYLVNTHIHGDHTGGNLGLGRGVDIIAHHNVKAFLGRDRQQGGQSLPGFPAWAQPNISFSDELELVFNGQVLKMRHLPGGHTDSDLVVYFPDSRVLVAGDLLFAGNFPYVDTGNGGHPITFLENLDKIISGYPDALVINGGHGPLYTMEELKAYRQTLQDTVEAVRAAKERGLSAEEARKARVLQPWEDMGRFFITEDRWIDTLYPFL